MASFLCATSDHQPTLTSIHSPTFLLLYINPTQSIALTRTQSHNSPITISIAWKPMETNGVTSHRRRNSPSSERFLGLFSDNPNGNGNQQPSSTSVIGDELDEDDVFWTGDFSLSDHRKDSSSTVHDQKHRSSPASVRRVDSSGILAALPEDTPKKPPGDKNRLLYRKISLPSPSPSPRMIPAVPRRQTSMDRDFLLAASGNFRHSAPVNVPVRPKSKGRQTMVSLPSDDDDDDSDKEMLPPHEIVARGSSQADMTFSVLEGVGRTLKGRDLRQVRNAVWRQTGFLD